MENSREGLLLGCGNPLLDIIATVDDEFLQKYGLKPDDAILADEVKHKNLYKELAEMDSVQYMAGGSCQNSLRVAQWILRKPKVCAFFGCVGDDDYAKTLSEKATADGVNVLYQQNDALPTGTCAVALTNHHRSLCANLAAANTFTVDHINKPENRKVVDNAKYFYATGFFLTASAETVQAIAKHSLATNGTFLMNLSAPFLAQFYKQQLMDALPFADIVFGNETEALAFAKEVSFETENLHEIALKICQLPKQNESRERVAIVTQGKDPVLLAHNGKVFEIPVQKLSNDEIVDTNGAGDAFVGGFLAQYVQEKPLETCIRCGIWAAQEIIKRSGCSFEGEANFQE
ncbi:adenosine kinase [Contarinia nasturtii]|uniref:adenosine kinase n=1 Tax=Contarinia nasturtii TaxID=265458 RepID=UPI0012D3C3DE|nr:adenosine kinase [Contarinia nasturtii]